MPDEFGFDYQKSFTGILFELFQSEMNQEFDFLQFYENFIFILRSLKHSNEKALLEMTFCKLSQEI